MKSIFFCEIWLSFLKRSGNEVFLLVSMIFFVVVYIDGFCYLG